jgi:dipeptidyl-peptidase-3
MVIVLGVSDPRQYLLERVDDAAVVQLYADGFTALPLREKILAWHLYLAALAGRDIYYDQRHALNLDIRDLLETILRHAQQVEPVVLEAQMLEYSAFARDADVLATPAASR